MDEQGNVGRLVVVDRGAPGGGGPPGGGPGGSGGGGTGGALGGTGGGGGTPGAGTPTTPQTKKFSLGGITRHSDGSITLKVTVPGAGTLEAVDADAGKASAAAKRKALIKRQKRTVKSAGTVKLRLRPSNAGRTKLRQRGRAKLRVKVTYRPRGGGATSKTKQATLTVRRR